MVRRRTRPAVELMNGMVAHHVSEPNEMAQVVVWPLKGGEVAGGPIRVTKTNQKKPQYSYQCEHGCNMYTCRECPLCPHKKKQKCCTTCKKIPANQCKHDKYKHSCIECKYENKYEEKTLLLQRENTALKGENDALQREIIALKQKMSLEPNLENQLTQLTSDTPLI